MLVIRLIANGVMYYLVDLDESLSNGLISIWTLLGNKVKSFPDEQSAMRTMEKFLDYPPSEHAFVQWDDSDEKIAFEKKDTYYGKPLLPAKCEVQVIDLTDMVIARTKKITFLE